MTHDTIVGLSLGNQRQDSRAVLQKEKAKQQAGKKVEDVALEILAQ